jgi:hypothetical protein
MKVKILTVIGAALVAMVVASSGSAKWVIGNGTTDIEVTGPNPALPGQVCTTHIEGRAGLSTSVDPAVTPPPPPPYSPRVIELFTGPPGSLDGYAGGPPGQLVPPDPSLPTFLAVTSVTTAAPTALNPPEHYTGNGNEDLWEYAAAPFSFDLPAGAIADGNEVALRLGSHAAIVTLSAITCAAPSVTINQAVGQADPTSIGPIHFTVVFNEAVSGFATGDLSLSGTAGATTAVVSESAPNNGTTYDVAVSGMTTSGTVIASLLAGVATNGGGIGNTASTSTDNTVSFVSAQGQLSALFDAVKNVPPGKALGNKVKQIQAYVAANNTAAACAGLNDFIELVKAQKGKKLTNGQIADFTAQANAIKTTLGC